VCDNIATTRYAEEVCQAEVVTMDPVTQSISDAPSDAVRAADRRVAGVLRRRLRSSAPRPVAKE
jgi:hypothetical protein